ncbi:MAG: CBS domain-containing protein, partial [Nitrospira sp.]|nr:CBS domain-containing protein [Nitrospira sp.]
MDKHAGGAVKDFMHRYLEVVPQDSTVTAAAERMAVRRIGCLLVDSEDPKRGPVGIMTEADLVRKVLAVGLDPMATMVDHVMVNPILTIDGAHSMLDA